MGIIIVVNGMVKGHRRHRRQHHQGRRKRVNRALHHHHLASLIITTISPRLMSCLNRSPSLDPWFCCNSHHLHHKPLMVTVALIMTVLFMAWTVKLAVPWRIIWSLGMWAGAIATVTHNTSSRSSLNHLISYQTPSRPDIAKRLFRTVRSQVVVTAVTSSAKAVGRRRRCGCFWACRASGQRNISIQSVLCLRGKPKSEAANNGFFPLLLNVPDVLG